MSLGEGGGGCGGVVRTPSAGMNPVWHLCNSPAPDRTSRHPAAAGDGTARSAAADRWRCWSLEDGAPRVPRLRRPRASGVPAARRHGADAPVAGGERAVGGGRAVQPAPGAVTSGRASSSRRRGWRGPRSGASRTRRRGGGAGCGTRGGGRLQDVRFAEAFAAEIRRLFPGCPEDRARAIAAHASVRGSGRVGRSAAGRALSEGAVTVGGRGGRAAYGHAVRPAADERGGPARGAAADRGGCGDGAAGVAGGKGWREGSRAAGLGTAGQGGGAEAEAG